jgi:lipid-A-disaccharide synthase
MTRFFVIAGEVSGDTHGAELLGALTEQGGPSNPQFLGLGGPKMRARAPEVTDWLDESAVLGLWEVLKKYGYFKARMTETVNTIERLQPDVTILIDYPGFNLRLAKALRQRGYRGRIAYYISPQVWAWKRGRIREMARTLDLMMCIFPFEKALYEASGLRTEFVGHPLVDELQAERIDTQRDPNQIGLFPGSRRREIEALFPAMVEAATLLAAEHPGLRFVTAAANQTLASRLQQLAQIEGAPEITVSHGDVHRLMQTCGCAVIASGTATLEAAFFGLPYCLTYKVAWLTAAVARVVMQVKYLGIVNNLAGREVVEELLQERANGPSLAAALKALLDSPSRRETLSLELRDVAAKLGPGGAHAAAARAILHLLQTPSRL